MHSRRWATFVVFGLGAAVLGGCPIYPDSRDHTVCLQDGTCYSCPNDYYSSDCYSYACSSNYDCPSGYACDRGACVSGRPSYDAGLRDSGMACSTPSECPSGYTCGVDRACHLGDCASAGCPSGYQCKLSGGVLQCVGGTAPDAGDAGKDGGTFTGCHNDTECSTPAGSKCLNGACVAPQDQCFDATQCPNDEQCVAGVCTPGCSGTSCPTGFSCDSKTNVCSGNPTPCGATADGGTCAGGNVCVEDHCVAPCGAGNVCPAGQVCIAGGCIPDQRAKFTCTTEGVQDECASGSICIHHACYIACDVDAGANACKNADKFNVCKSVTTASGTYAVCSP